MGKKNDANYEAIRTLLKDKCGDLTIQAVLTEVAKIEYNNTHLPEDFNSEKSYKQEIIRDYIEKSQNYIEELEKSLEICETRLRHEFAATEKRIECFKEVLDQLKADGLYEKYCGNKEDLDIGEN